MTNPKMREIGRLLKDEESRFIGYPEIEQKSKELGFGMTVRTLRFYVDEGILPPPKKVGKAPVYEEDWILNVLLSIHLMKTRLDRSLSEIRVILQRLQEDPAVLADKLSVLYEDQVKNGTLKPVERMWLIEAFFGLLTGKFERARNASEVRISDLLRAVKELGNWKTPDSWEPPDPQKVRLLLGEGEPRPEVKAADREPPKQASRVEPNPTPPPPPAKPEPSPEPAPAVISGEGIVPLEKARSLEETFVSRFEAAFEARTHVPSPLEGTVLKCGPRERSHLKRDHSSKVIELMKRNRVYDRALLDAIPLDEASEYHVYQRSFLGKGDLRVVVAALVLSPLEAFVTQRKAQAPLTARDIERSVSELVVQEDIFYYVGILSTTGWDKDAKQSVPAGRNLLVALVEQDKAPPENGNPWVRHFAGDARWGGLERLFDPETDREKVDRVRAFFQATDELRPKGGHVILRNVKEDLNVPEEALRTAVAELCATDPELSVVEVGGREILKRRRI
ncbi:MAG TPA: MerR family transcriptional regulator [Planctomycetota bacterium]|nr:MerR family transcriptional regulator [Planctomycetota bacterium]